MFRPGNASVSQMPPGLFNSELFLIDLYVGMLGGPFNIRTKSKAHAEMPLQPWVELDLGSALISILPNLPLVHRTEPLPLINRAGCKCPTNLYRNTASSFIQRGVIHSVSL